MSFIDEEKGILAAYEQIHYDSRTKCVNINYQGVK